MRRERGEHGAPENTRVEDEDQHRVFARWAGRALAGVRAQPGRPRGIEADHERGHLGDEGRDAGQATGDQAVVDRLQLRCPLRVHQPVAVEAAGLPAPTLVARDQDRAQQAGFGGLGLPLLDLAREPFLIVGARPRHGAEGAEQSAHLTRQVVAEPNGGRLHAGPQAILLRAG
jgi:hypothetical protein